MLTLKYPAIYPSDNGAAFPPVTGRVPDLRQQHFLIGGLGRRGGGGLLLAVEAVHRLHQTEHGKSHDEEVQHGVEEAAQHHFAAAGDGEGQVGQGAVAAGKDPQNGVDDVIHQ